MEAFAALADPTRRGILEMLGSDPRTAGQIAEGFAISPPAISQHLKTLREARLIHVRIDAQRRIYAIDPTGLREMDRWLAQYRRFWNAKLDLLEARLCADATATQPRAAHQTAGKKTTPTRKKGKTR